MAKRHCSNPGSLLGYLRLHSRLSMQELSSICHVHPMSICRIEQGNYNVYLESVLRVIGYFELSLEELIHNRFDLVIPRLQSNFDDGTAAQGRQALTQQRKMDLGRRGELWVAHLEQEKLKNTGFANGVDIGPSLDPSRGFDCYSFTLEKEPLFIEVKTTSNHKDTAFFMSANERYFMEFCLQNGLNYELHRVFDIDRKPKRHIYTAEDLTDFTFIPTDYLVKKEHHT